MAGMGEVSAIHASNVEMDARLELCCGKQTCSCCRETSPPLQRCLGADAQIKRVIFQGLP